MPAKSQLKVGVFNEGNIPSLFAHSFSVMKMAQGFATLDCKVQVVTADSLKAAFRRRKYPNLADHYGLSSQVPVTWLRPSLKTYLTSDTGGDLLLAQRSLNLAKKEELQLVYARSYLLPVLSIKAGIPTVMETHTTLYDHPDLSEIYGVADLPAFKCLVTIHHDIAQEHVKRGIPEEKILVLEDGVDLERFEVNDDVLAWRSELGLDPIKRYAVYSGHLYKDKGIDMILAAAKQLADRKDLVFLLVGGFDSDRHVWEKKSRDVGLANIKFTGFMPNAKVPGYLKAADCLLLPYRMDMKHTVMDIHTTSPLKLFEYMAAGRPIVATDIPTVAKVLNDGESALLVPPGEIKAFCDAIEKCLDRPEVASGLSRQAGQIVQQHSWSSRCQHILAHAFEV